MRKNRALSAVVVLAAAPFACGGGGGGSGTIDAPVHDSPVSIDAPIADAPPDAAPADLSCLNDTAPTTTSATTITVGGSAETIAGFGLGPASGATVELFENGNAVALQTVTAGSDGSFTFSAVQTQGSALDLFVTAAGSGSSDVPDQFFPAAPLVADAPNVPMFLVPSADLQLLGQSPNGSGAFGLIVTDCVGAPISGATITTDPAGGSATELGPATGASALNGFYAIPNMPTGSATITVATGGTQLPTRTLTSVANTLVTTQILPSQH